MVIVGRGSPVYISQNRAQNPEIHSVIVTNIFYNINKYIFRNGTGSTVYISQNRAQNPSLLSSSEGGGKVKHFVLFLHRPNLRLATLTPHVNIVATRMQCKSVGKQFVKVDHSPPSLFLDTQVSLEPTPVSK